VAEAIRDIWDFYLIARTLPAEREADMAGKLKLMLRGEISAAKDNSNTPRDIRFEYLVAAVFAMADIPTRPAEPDLHFLIRDTEWGASIKRVRSEAPAPRSQAPCVAVLMGPGCVASRFLTTDSTTSARRFTPTDDTSG